ncbi:MAG: RlpA-like double-psi beta-barrel-protein domain-containing protein-containing protein, partial [Piptocephalis tieghemiana]
FSGQGTYYDISSQGISCEKQDLPKENGDMVAAINGKQYKKSLCGKCVQATGPIGTVKVQIVDYCSSCPHGDLDFTPEAFDKIAKRKDGRVPISWSF